jgi:hypothetical protein
MRIITPKILSIKNPWADLIVHGTKRLENRTRRTLYRGLFFIHVPLGFGKVGYNLLGETKGCGPNGEIEGIKDMLALGLQRYPDQKGMIIGSAEVVGCEADMLDPWFMGPWGWKLANVYPLEPTPFKGMLGFVNMEGWQVCPKCKGRGNCTDDSDLWCPECSGHGVLKCN